MDTTRENYRRNSRKIAQQELKEAQEQIAATIAVGHNPRSFSPPKGIFKFFLKASGLKIILPILVILAILVFLVITSGGIRLSVGNILGSTFKQESVTFVEQVQELATLATAKVHTKVVLHEEDSKFWNLPGTQRDFQIVVPATVIAGVDLKGITSEDMAINEETKEIDITLPHADLIQEPSVQMDKIQYIDNVGIFRGDIKGDERVALLAKAQDQMRQDAISSGLLDTAEKNAEKALKEFFKNDGYTVNVTFK